MKNIQKLIEREGGLEWLKGDGNYIRLKPEGRGLMRLVIEYIGTGPRGKPLISVAHYYEQNGDAMRDPEVTFELELWEGFTFKEWSFLPVTFQQDNLGIYQELVYKDGDKTIRLEGRIRSVESFAKLWDKNIGEQGFMTMPNAVKKSEVAA